MAYRGGVIVLVFELSLVCGAAAGCSSGHGTRGDAAADAPLPHDLAPEHDYPEAGPPKPLGAPLQASLRQWKWIDFPDSRCRDGSSTGLGINLSNASTNVMVFVDQGGACFNVATCTFNPASYGAADFGAGPSEGIFNRTDPDNPVRDFSFVFVPYCTGDVNAGNQPAGSIPGVGAQQFVGYRNLDVFLSRIVPTFAGVQQVLLAGSSAGGFGVLLNVDHVSSWFAPTPVTVLSDSGPPMSAATVAPCLQQSWNDLWGFQHSVLLDCGTDCPSASDYMIDDLFHHYGRFPRLHGGLISSSRDDTINLFFSFGLDNCAGGTLTADAFTAGLLDFRRQVQQGGLAFGTYYIPDTRHIWLMSDAGFATSVNGISLKSWVAALLGGATDHVGP